MKRKISIVAGVVSLLAACVAATAQEVSVVSVTAKPMEQTKAQAPGDEKIGDALYEVSYECDVGTKATGQLSASSEGNVIKVQTGKAEMTEGEDDGVTDTYTTILQFGPGQARFLDYLAYRVDSLVFAGATDESLSKASKEVDRSAFYFDPVVFQNLPEGSLTVDDVLVPGTFSYSEDMALEWAFGDGQKEVCGYPCQEAKASYGGREWTVWFTPSVPANAGPWKLCGLPGLIMEAQDAEGIHHFTATSLRKAGCPIVRVQDAGRDKTQRDRFIQRKNAAGGNSLNNVPTESISTISVFKNDNGGTIKINGRVTVRMTNHTWIPLELK